MSVLRIVLTLKLRISVGNGPFREQCLCMEAPQYRSTGRDENDRTPYIASASLLP